MTLNELSRYYWARMSQASYMEGAMRNFELGGVYEYGTWSCLLNWVYYKDIADTIEKTHGYIEMTEAMVLSNEGEVK
jgi:hypothetical protein